MSVLPQIDYKRQTEGGALCPALTELKTCDFVGRDAVCVDPRDCAVRCCLCCSGMHGTALIDDACTLSRALVDGPLGGR